MLTASLAVLVLYDAAVYTCARLREMLHHLLLPANIPWPHIQRHHIFTSGIRHLMGYRHVLGQSPDVSANLGKLGGFHRRTHRRCQKGQMLQPGSQILCISYL